MGCVSDGRETVWQNHATFLDPVWLPGREHVRQWAALIERLPIQVKMRIRGLVSDNLRGMRTLAQQHGWVLQWCQFYLTSQLHTRRHQWKCLPDWARREYLYGLTRRVLELPVGRALHRTVQALRRAATSSMPGRKMGMAIRQCLRDLPHYRAYHEYPWFGLPTTTNTVECRGRLIRDLSRRTRYLRSPQALQAWVAAFVRMRSALTCNDNQFFNRIIWFEPQTSVGKRSFVEWTRHWLNNRLTQDRDRIPA
jgi:hypothetical protein